MYVEHPVEVAGQRGRWSAVGAGPTLVVLATPFVLARSYVDPVALLSQRFRVVTIQLPGSGGADKLPVPWSIADYARWSAAALDVLDITAAALIGHSHSGAVALHVAAERPERVARLVLADAVGGEGPQSLGRVLLGRCIDALLEPGLSLRAWHHLVYNVLAHWRNFRRQIVHAVQADGRALARRVTVPTLLAWGARDHTTPLGGAASLFRRLARPSLYVAPTGSHDWMIDHADEFAAAVTDFIARTAAHDAALARREPTWRMRHELAR